LARLVARCRAVVTNEPQWAIAASFAPLVSVSGASSLSSAWSSRVWSSTSRRRTALWRCRSISRRIRSRQLGFRKDETAGELVVLRDATVAGDALVALDEGRLEQVWNGQLVLMKKRHRAGDEQQPFGLWWLFSQVMRERAIFRDVSIAALFATVFAVAPPFMVMIIIDRVLVHHSTSTLLVITVAIGLIICFEVILTYFRRRLMEVVTTRIDGRLNLYIVAKLLRLPIDYFEKNPTGLIMSKIARTGQIRHFLTGQLFGTFLDAIPLLGLIPALVILDWRLSLFVFALTGIIFVIVLVFLKPVGRRFGAVIAAEQRKGAHLVETIYGMRTIKSLALEGRRQHEWDARVATALMAQYEYGIFTNYPQTLTMPFERLIYSGSFVLGAYLALYDPGAYGPGALFAFVLLSGRMAGPLVQMAKLMQDMGEAGGAISELSSIMNAPSEDNRAGSGLRRIRVCYRAPCTNRRHHAGRCTHRVLDLRCVDRASGST
jgi:ATP-binding cassette subfamily B protein